ncbi:ScaI family restriction endonuclease [Lawsonibacter sp. OA9]|uniref:ScaI family restriction endonuclease n=1 Tax=Lawsonibacter sp. OA9 TaxID=2914163 RepID=UPI001F0514DB|nr:ScaI family restriction endonuclease [Lawsonibacter sp. OA9]MCH1978688.1 ScaI family restriction endonuclease [Lawsonibacter sp. OA9]
MESPYEGYSVSDWDKITEDLIAEHPLSEEEIVDAVLDAWERIKITKIGGELQIGVDIFPSPQIMGNYLHELIPVILAHKYPGIWRKECSKDEKDIVYIPNDCYSVEIKTSSNATNIFGNRSYGQENSENNSGKKKYGYYITVNFEKYTESNHNPRIKKIRFGWIDHSDWHAQAAATGQQASLALDARDHKLKLLYSV